MKKIIFISISVLLITGILTGCGCKKSDKIESIVPQYEANFDITKEQEVEGLKFTDVSLIINKNGISEFSAKVTNTNDEIYKLSTIKMIFKDKKGNLVDYFIGVIGSDITPNESRSLTFTTDKDLTKASQIEYEIIK